MLRNRPRTVLGVEDLESRIVPAAVVRYDHFNVTNGLVLNGSTERVRGTEAGGRGHVLRLADAEPFDGGSVFSQTQVSTSQFSTFFVFRISNRGGESDSYNEPGADGIAFVIQPHSSSLGGQGSGIGYAGITRSVAVEFDTFGNNGGRWEAFDDPSSNHVGITTNGFPDHGPGAPFTRNVEPDFDNEHLWYAWVDYDGTTLEVRVRSDSSDRPAQPTLTRQMSIPVILGQSTAYIGFTSATGLAWADHDIVRWEYRTGFDPITTTPEAVVFGNGVEIADNDSTPSTADDTDFGAINAGVPLTHTFTVRNTGQDTLTTSGLTVPAGFTITEGLAAELLPGKSDTFTIRLDATTSGTFNGTVSFRTNDSNEGVYNFAVRGVVQGGAAAILGRVYNDANTNGQLDANEAGLGLFQVFLDTDNDGVLDANEQSMTTRIYGNFGFRNLTPGTYHVRVVPVAGLAFTQPTGGLLTLTVTAGQNSSGNRFGIRSTT